MSVNCVRRRKSVYTCFVNRNSRNESIIPCVQRKYVRRKRPWSKSMKINKSETGTQLQGAEWKHGWVSECSWSILACFVAQKYHSQKFHATHCHRSIIIRCQDVLVVGEHESYHTWFRNARQPSDNSHSTASGTVSLLFFCRVLCYIWMTSVYFHRFENYLCLRVPFIAVFVETRKMIRKCFVIHKITNGLRGFRLDFGRNASSNWLQ